VQSVDALKPAVLLHLNTLTIVIAILHRDVVPLLTDLALEGHLDPLVVLRHRGLLVPYPLRQRRRVLILVSSVAAAGLEPATTRL
jgi:hypothetical protein